MKPVAQSKWSGGYAFHPFKMRTTEVSFPYSRNNTAGPSKGCNIASAWTPYIQETLVNGVLQGRKQTDSRGASALSQGRLWELFLEVHSMLSSHEKGPVMIVGNYLEFKRSDTLKNRRDVKSEAKEKALSGWGEGLNHILKRT